MINKRRNLMIVLSSPSGAGKTTICKELLKFDKKLKMSISATTRQKRSSEKEGIDYFFFSKKEFKNDIKNGKFFEHAFVFENYYGTPKEFVYKTLENGFDVIFDIDWQGAKQLSKKVKKELISFFILPPNTEELLKRLKKRNEDSFDTVKSRMSKAKSEMSHWNEYDYVIVNENLRKCVNEILMIIEVERKKRFRQPSLEKFVKSLVIE